MEESGCDASVIVACGGNIDGSRLSTLVTCINVTDVI